MQNINVNILFCESIIAQNTVDEAFSVEYEIAKNNNFNVFMLDHEDFSTKKIKQNNTLEKIIYRGWMLTPEQYKTIYNELLHKNYMLINDPIEYQNCHYLPDSLQFIENYTPKTIFQKIENNESINKLIENSKIFGGKPIIIKDFVKSEKHYWNTACFVENSNDIQKLRESINNFINLRENSLNEGIVLREYIELNIFANHSQSGMPMSEEYRLFFYNNELVNIYNYWECGNYCTDKPDTKHFENIAKNIKSNFFTMDIAKDRNGKYWIIELGDGQVSGIPETEDKNQFYKKLKDIIVKQNGT
jgi:hypothetical protein